uniref:Hemagglutinin/amebocyte aggregation factor n=1 Tax=Paramormyrops kingsleyae TaxID=1676925 RepID=A0A3B3TDP0_9TELE
PSSELVFLVLKLVFVHDIYLPFSCDLRCLIQLCCPVKQMQVSTSFFSKHDNLYEDRIWEFQCKDTFNSNPQCFWTNYVNSFDEQFTFVCPNNYVMTGMGSIHDDKYGDRRWQFQCCQTYNYCNYNCQWTPYVNFYDEEFTWLVPSMNYLVGAESVHSNSYEYV